jgi:hypothetical protein
MEPAHRCIAVFLASFLIEDWFAREQSHIGYSAEWRHPEVVIGAQSERYLEAAPVV